MILGLTLVPVLLAKLWSVIPKLFAWPPSRSPYPAHLYGAWIFLAAFVVHVAVKLPRMVRALRSRSLGRERLPGTDHRPERPRRAQHQMGRTARFWPSSS
ncbi:hypothetical protein ACRYCC_15145 [Actinomadura scrupuli]|uniref:hypothetical protein n=1 Tax=Actinomadura scrupuli TaxID=559629 RepID=UPI003D9870C0